MMQVSQGRAYKKTTDIMLMISIAFFLSAEDDQYCIFFYQQKMISIAW